MLTLAKRVAIPLIALACLGLSACGGGKKEPAVVKVGDNAITAATVQHWVQVESVTSHGGARVTQPQPKGAVPVPPEYTDCVAYLIQLSVAGHNVKLTPGSARAQCAFQYKVYKETILGTLINYYWDIEEGAAKGLHITDAEVAQYLKQLYPHPGEFTRYLKLTHETLADERLLISGKLMRGKLVALSERTARSQAERVRVVTKSVQDEAARWAPRTDCTRGYVVPQCRQFRGSHAIA